MGLLPSHIRHSTGSELAADFARSRLSAARGRRPTVALIDAVALGRAVGLGASEIQRVGGCSRQTVYNLLRAERDDVPPMQLGLELLACATAVAGEATTSELADRLRVDLGAAMDTARGLVTRGELSAAAPVPMPATLVAATDRGEARLREALDEMLHRRPEGIAVYIAVAEKEARVIEGVAGRMIGQQEHVLLDASVAPSKMHGPELAMLVHAASIRGAIEIAEDLWKDLREQAGLPPSAMRVTSVLPPAEPPALPSGVLDAFLDGMAATAPAQAVAVARRARERFDGRAREKELAARCLTVAASGLRLALGRDRGAPPIADGERAFGELGAVDGLSLDTEGERIRRPLRRALDRACETLGPLPGGRLGSLRAPGGPPKIVESVSPTEQDLLAIAEDSGAAVGAAVNADALDPETATLTIVLGSD